LNEYNWDLKKYLNKIMKKLFDYKSPNPGSMSENMRQYLTKKQLTDLCKEKAIQLNSAEEALKSLAA